MSEKLAELKKKGSAGGAEMPFLVAIDSGAHLYFESGDGGVIEGYKGGIYYQNNFSFSATIPGIGVAKWNYPTLRIVPDKNCTAYILNSGIMSTNPPNQAKISRTSANLTANTNYDMTIENGAVCHILFE